MLSSSRCVADPPVPKKQNGACAREEEEGEESGGNEEKPEGEGRHLEAHLPFWEPGCGHYGATLGQYSKAVVNDCVPLILSFLEDTPERRSPVFTVADYGANDGYSSLTLIEAIIERVRKTSGSDVPIQVIYEDQKGNDFNSLFNRISEGPGCLYDMTGVFPMATNVSFYRQCVPDVTCDVIFTCMTTHWLDSLDVTFKDCVFFSSLKDDDVDTLSRVHKAAERDWQTFLLHRARELKPGGLLVVLSLSAFDNYRRSGSARMSTPCCDDRNNHEDSTKSPRREVLGRLYEQGVGGNDVRHDLESAWRALRDDNSITQEEFEKCMAPCYIRTAKEILTPFETVTSPVNAAELSLVHHDQIVCPFFTKEIWREKLRKEGVDDRELFARMTTSAHRTWSSTTFHSCLGSDRSPEEKAAIMNRLYDHFQSSVMAANPEEYNTDYILSRLVACKR